MNVFVSSVAFYMNVFVSHVYCLIESLVSILRYKDITIIKSQYLIIKNLLFFCANVYTKQRLTFCCTRYFHLKKRPCPCTIFAFPTSQNYELSAQGNLWLEILEFWTISAILLIHNGLQRQTVKSTKNTNVKMLHFSAKGPLLHSNCTPFTLQLYSICTVNVVLLKSKRTTNERQYAIRPSKKHKNRPRKSLESIFIL